MNALFLTRALTTYLLPETQRVHPAMKVIVVISGSEDEEIARIHRKKMAEMLQRAQAQSHPAAKADGKPITLADACFSSEVTKQKLMVVDFWAPWCGPCRMVGPIIEQLAAEYAGRVTFGKLNVDDNPTVPRSFGIQSIPTLARALSKMANQSKP